MTAAKRESKAADRPKENDAEKKRGGVSDLLIFILSSELIGTLSGLFAGDSGGLYSAFEKPPLSPPGWVFPVVWTILYALMGISAYLIYTADSGNKTKRRALTLYWAQLAVNFSWSIVFFRFQALAASVAVIVVLIILVIAMIVSFFRIRRSAGLINIPYLLWLLFAAYLNIATAILN